MNNTLKVVNTLKFILDHPELGLEAENNLEHVFMMDDDSYVNVPKLYAELFEKVSNMKPFGGSIDNV